jgi:predicted MFS family arabinose efflux permease
MKFALPAGGVNSLLALACAVAVANVYYAQPLLAAMATDLHIDPALAGSVVAVTLVGYGMGLLLLVPLGDMVEPRRLIAGLLVLLSIALLTVGYASSAEALLAGMALVGLLAAVVQLLVAHASLLAAPSQRGRAVAIVTIGVVAGIVGARVVSAATADLFGWRAVFFGSAAGSAAMALALSAVLPNERRQMTTTPYPRVVASVFALLLHEPLIRARGILGLLTFAAITVVLTPLIFALSAPPWNLSTWQVGLFGLSGIAGAIGAGYAGRSTDRGAGQRSTGIGLLLMLMAWFPIAFLERSLWSLAFGLVLLDFGLQAVHVSSQGIVYSSRPQARNRVAAAYMMFYSAGCALGAALSTRIFAQAGWVGVCAAGFGIVSAAMAWWAITLRAAAPRLSAQS